jgi:hypothetical protein
MRIATGVKIFEPTDYHKACLYDRMASVGLGWVCSMVVDQNWAGIPQARDTISHGLVRISIETTGIAIVRISIDEAVVLLIKCAVAVAVIVVVVG